MAKMQKHIINGIKNKFNLGILIAVISLSLGMGISVFLGNGKQAEIFVTNPVIDGVDLILDKVDINNNYDLNVSLVVDPNGNTVNGFDTQLEFDPVVLKLDLSSFSSLKTDCWQLAQSNGYQLNISKVSEGHYDISIFSNVTQPGITTRQSVLTLNFSRLNQSNTGISLLASKSVVAVDGYNLNALRNVAGLILSDNANQVACQKANGTWKEFPNGCVDMCSLVTNPGQNCTQALTYGCDCGASKCWNGTTCVNNPTTNNNQITLKTKLDGVNKKDHIINIKVTLYDSKDTKVKTDDVAVFGPAQIRFVSNESGEYTSDPITFAYQTYPRISVELKGPKHMVEYFSNIESVASKNLSYRSLAPGDLPWNNGAQDNKVDDKDFEAITTRLGSTEQSNLNIADVNYDGIVDLMDRSMVLSTWYKFLQNQ